MRSRTVSVSVVLAVLFSLAALTIAQTTVPGHQGRDGKVVGHYTSYYAEDGNGDYYWDLGDGRERGTVDSPDELDETSLVECDYQVVYRGDFGEDPFLNEGWTINNIVCKGPRGEGAETFHYRDNWGGDYPQFRNGSGD